MLWTLYAQPTASHIDMHSTSCVRTRCQENTQYFDNDIKETKVSRQLLKMESRNLGTASRQLRSYAPSRSRQEGWLPPTKRASAAKIN